jgi:hypothetical protein
MEALFAVVEPAEPVGGSSIGGVEGVELNEAAVVGLDVVAGEIRILSFRLEVCRFSRLREAHRLCAYFLPGNRRQNSGLLSGEAAKRLTINLRR